MSDYDAFRSAYAQRCSHPDRERLAYAFQSRGPLFRRHGPVSPMRNVQLIIAARWVNASCENTSLPATESPQSIESQFIICAFEGLLTMSHSRALFRSCLNPSSTPSVSS